MDVIIRKKITDIEKQNIAPEGINSTVLICHIVLATVLSTFLFVQGSLS